MIQQQRTTNNEQHTNDNDVVVSVKNVSKKFCKNLKRSMAYGIAELSKNVMGIKPDSTKLRKDEFWAVDNVSFELRRGEVLGLIGVNGSGKSTLLRLLAGIFPPDKGEITIRGRVGALISLGSGFHPHMTGRENIYLNGTILGMKREEIDSKFHDIVEFAEIYDFVDAPVSTYSSGMRVRLGFAIAAQIEPDILLIDEVLAVGDIGFRTKCFNAINSISNRAAVILVSHQMPQVARICLKILVMNTGKAVLLGENVPEGIEYYYSMFEMPRYSISGSDKIMIHQVILNSREATALPSKLTLVEYLQDLELEILLSSKMEIHNPKIVIFIYDQGMKPVIQCISSQSEHNFVVSSKLSKLKVIIPKIQLNSGKYSISISIFDMYRQEILCRHDFIKEFQVIGSSVGWAPLQLQAEWHYFDGKQG